MPVSPSTSTRTSRAAPNLGPSDRTGYHQTYLSPIDGGISPDVANNVSLLAPGYISQYDAIERSFQEQPWSPHNPRLSSAGGSRSPLGQSNVNYGSYRGLGGHVSPSDEGYYSQMAQSVLSNEPGPANQELPSIILRKNDNLNVDSVTDEAPSMSRRRSDQRSQVSSRSGKSSKQLQCSECPEILKCNSDHKKHKLKHDKPFKCEEPGCKRAGLGFTTTNDLDRHKKCVHRIDLTKKSYQCAAENCRNKEKIWPRLDNFKQHVERMHKDKDSIDLIKRSTFEPRQSAPPMDEITVAPMDTSFAVAGMEKSLSANPAIYTMPMMNLPMDQDNRRGPSFDHNPDDFPNYMPHMTQQLQGQSPVNNNDHPQTPQGPSRPQHRAPGITPRQGQPPLPVAATPVVPEQNTSEASMSNADPPLSNAPQTKAEQQRSALQKLSQAVSSPSNPVNLEEIILSMLQQATETAEWNGNPPREAQPGLNGQPGPKAITLTKSDALKASQAISNLIKQSSGSAYTVQRLSKGFLPNAKVCEECGNAVARDCDLRKHMKRHKKPYGCTYPRCKKRFGAKSDWKRHENSQHFQLEAFRCSHRLAAGEMCGKHVHSQEQFKAHFETWHKISAPDVLQDAMKRAKIGKNCQGTFWCGFCSQVTELKTRRNAAWDERFDHIAQHFEKEKRGIEEWVCVEENRCKRELAREREKDEGLGDGDGDEDGDVDAVGEVDDDFLVPPTEVLEELLVSRNNGPPPPPQGYEQVTGRRRSAPEDHPLPQRRTKRRQTMTMMIRYCVSN
ncbi:hypothetical protein EJ02DRAFT_350471 [Clathrospora elynae]|uniref:C2H2-type domain-containing protein n=1 Tax=Clathrospora elynae TaxID=706981 RepID=A0A6A5SKT8_9PLEO|nr:hypothetical protein EJ02DRAFT_350471 [Clathrospora elynae]